MDKIFILYDSRARNIRDTEKATILDTAESEEEIKLIKKHYPGLHPSDSIWYEYDHSGKELLNGKPRFDL